jgi:HEAT repeat protein
MAGNGRGTTTSMDLSKGPMTSVTTGAEALDARALEKIRDFLHHLANTVSAMKIFPAEHTTSKTFIDDLSQKITSFLDVYGKLDISVEEFSFVCDGKPVYTDEMAIKSLPFFFFKDGMQKLYFYQGLDRQELLDFLDLIKKESKKPAGQSDIITALWEKDFAHIQYFAPDEFLENRILQECGFSQQGAPAKGQGADVGEFSHKAIEIKVDTSKFSKGKIELSAEDRDVVQMRSAMKGLEEEEAPRIALEKVAESRGSPEFRRGTGTAKLPAALQSPKAHPPPETPEEPEPPHDEEPRTAAGKAVTKEIGESWRSPLSAMDLTMTAPEVLDLEALVSSSRKISPDQEFLNLIADILNLEKGLENFDSTLGILMEYHLDQLLQGNFNFSILLVHKLWELKAYLSAKSPEKSARIDSLLKKIGSAKSLEVIKGLLEKSQSMDWDGLVEFFRLLGNAALPLAADIYESVPDPESQKKMLDFIRTMSAQDPGSLVSMAADERPLLSKAVIGLLGRAFGKKGLPHFAAFLGFKNKDIKLEAIRALGEIQDEMANRILLGFLNDKDEDLRIQAALRLNPIEERSRIHHLIEEAGSRDFRAKSLKEKQAILSFLGRTGTEQALDFLRRILVKRHLRLTDKTKEMKLAAVAGLESLGTEDAVRALEKGARSRNKAVRETSSQALAHLAKSKPSHV